MSKQDGGVPLWSELFAPFTDKELAEALVSAVDMSAQGVSRRMLVSRWVRELGGAGGAAEFLAANGIEVTPAGLRSLDSLVGSAVFLRDEDLSRLVFVGPGDDRYIDFVEDIEQMLADEGQEHVRVAYDPEFNTLYSVEVDVVLRPLGSPAKIGICPGCGGSFQKSGCVCCGWRRPKR